MFGQTWTSIFCGGEHKKEEEEWYEATVKDDQLWEKKWEKVTVSFL